MALLTRWIWLRINILRAFDTPSFACYIPTNLYIMVRKFNFWSKWCLATFSWVSIKFIKFNFFNWRLRFNLKSRQSDVPIVKAKSAQYFILNLFTSLFMMMPTQSSFSTNMRIWGPTVVEGDKGGEKGRQGRKTEHIKTEFPQMLPVKWRHLHCVNIGP